MKEKAEGYPVIIGVRSVDDETLELIMSKDPKKRKQGVQNILTKADFDGNVLMKADFGKEEPKEEDENNFVFPDKWDVKQVYNVLEGLREASVGLYDVMLRVIGDSDISKPYKKPVFELARLINEATESFNEAERWIDSDGFLLEEEEYEWDDEDAWDDDEFCAAYYRREDEDDENH